MEAVHPTPAEASELVLYNTLSRQKETFTPLTPGHVGMYVCGPTVYSFAHLGNARPALTFDVLGRWLTYNGLKLRYVRNITDVGHLENDADEGEDKMAKQARLEQLEPMEVAERYTNAYLDMMQRLNMRPPSITPRATGHIIEQIELIERIIEAGYAYVVEGSVYFDVAKWNETGEYGKLSGRVLEDLIAGAGEEVRVLKGQSDKRSPADFALWKHAMPEHIMRWPSPWGEGFPGWHIECTAMGAKYLGNQFDIHGGGMDLMFPHHECERAQAQAGLAHADDEEKHYEPVRYWMHCNMVTVEGKKMGKSLGNFITLPDLFAGTHPVLSQGYEPMAVRFFMLQAHYRSTLDFSNEALQAATAGLKRLMAGLDLLFTLKPEGINAAGEPAPFTADEWRHKAHGALNDDLNTPILIAHLYELVSLAHKLSAGQTRIEPEELDALQAAARGLAVEVLGLEGVEAKAGDQSDRVDGLVKLLIEQRASAKATRDFARADGLRDELLALGVTLKDSKDGTTYELS